MSKKRNIQQELNEAKTPLDIFLEAYNANLPAGFPSASARLLEKFREAHPVLFSGSNSWSVDKHRKRVMDWLSSHNDS